MCLVVRHLCISVTSSLYLPRNTVTGSDILATQLDAIPSTSIPYPSSNVLMLAILNKNRNISPNMMWAPRPLRAQKKSDLHVIWWVLVHRVSCMALFMLGVFLCIRVLLWQQTLKHDTLSCGHLRGSESLLTSLSVVTVSAWQKMEPLFFFLF